MTNKKFLDYDGLVYFYSLLKNQFAPISGSGTYLTQTTFNSSNPDLAAIEALSGSGILTRSNADNSWSLDTTKYIYTNSGGSEGFPLMRDGSNLGSGYILPHPSNNQTQTIVTDQTVPKAATGGSGGGTPQMDGTAAVGTSTNYARADHVHPTDTTRQPLIDSSHKLSADLLEDGSTNHVFTADDDTKLTGIATGAEVNQNAFSKVQIVGDKDTIDASSKTDTLMVSEAANSLISLAKDITSGQRKLIFDVDKDLSKYDNTTSGFITSASIPVATSTTPKMDGTASVGSETTWAKGDHVHPTDTSRHPKIDSSHKLSADLVEDGTNNHVFTAADDTKLSGIETGAQANQNAFATVRIRTGESAYTDLVSDSTGDTFEIVKGTNITLTADATNDKVTIASTDTKNTAGSTADAAKLYIVGAKSQAANPQTYSQANAYITAGEVYSNNSKVVNLADAQTISGKKTFSTIPELSASPAASDSSHKVADTSWVNDAISTAIGGVTQISYSIVNSLPNSGSVGVIYLVAKNGSDSSDGYDEYIWLTGSSKFELIGHKVLDLTEYWNTTNLTPLTNTDIAEVVNEYVATPGLTSSDDVRSLMQRYINNLNIQNNCAVTIGTLTAINNGFVAPLQNLSGSPFDGTSQATITYNRTSGACSTTAIDD